MSAASASAFPGRQRGGIASAALRVTSYQEPAATQPPATPETKQADSWSWSWPEDLANAPLAQLPPAPGTVTPATTTPAAAPLGTPDLLAGAVVFVGPSADPSAATSMSALGAHVVELATDPTTAQGAEIIGAAAAIARQLT